MPEQLSVFELIVNASLLVQLVMALLALASLVSWVMIFQRWVFLRRASIEVEDFEAHFWSGIDLRQLYGELEGEDATLNGIERIFVSGFREFTRLTDQSGADADAVMQGVQRAMRIALNREEARLETHLPFLATVGSTSPYVGLFGTVWGIMNSFRSLANMSQATLASVAPGISEALVATAMGLFAAIPAVIGYNRFSARVESL
ncbi:protein TolQ, partial [bacterium]|nr:protein TolQ [bacterium]